MKVANETKMNASNLLLTFLRAAEAPPKQCLVFQVGRSGLAARFDPEHPSSWQQRRIGRRIESVKNTVTFFYEEAEILADEEMDLCCTISLVPAKKLSTFLVEQYLALYNCLPTSCCQPSV